MDSSDELPKSGTASSPRHAHLHDVEPAGRGGQVALEAGADGRLGRRVGAAADLPHDRHADQTEHHERRARIAGQADHRHAAAVGEQRGLAGPEREPVTPDPGLAERGDGRGGLIARADGRAGRHDDHVTPVRTLDSERVRPLTGQPQGV